MREYEEHTVEIDEPEVTEDNYVQFLTPEREPLPEDTYGDPAPATNQDVPDEQAVVGRDDFDDDGEDDDGNDDNDTDDPAEPDLNAS